MGKFGLLSLILIGVTFGSLLSGCGDEETTQPVEEKAGVKVIHAAPGVQNVDIKFNDAVFAANRIFGNVTTYLTADAGAIDAKLYTAGGTMELAAKTLTFEKDKNYSLFIAADNAGTADLVLFTDDLTAPATGKAHIRVAHMIPDGPIIKVAIMQQGGPFAENVTFKDNTQGFVAVDAGAVTLRVQDNAVTGGGGGGTPPLLEKSVLLEAGKIYTLLAQGKIGDSTAELVLIEHS